MRVQSIVVGLFLGLSTGVVHAAEPAMLGVLEEPQCAKDKAARARIMP